MEAGTLWVQVHVKTYEKIIFILIAFFHIWVYLIIYNYCMHWVLVVSLTVCFYRLLQPVSWVWSITLSMLSYCTTFLGWGYSSICSLEDSCVLGDWSRKVVSSSPGEDTWNNYFHFNCILSYMGLPNNICNDSQEVLGENILYANEYQKTTTWRFMQWSLGKSDGWQQWFQMSIKYDSFQFPVSQLKKDMFLNF